MRLLLVISCALLLVALIPSAHAKRVGLIRIFAVTQHETNTRSHKLVKERRYGKVIGEVVQVCHYIGERQQCVGTLIMPLGKLSFTGTRRSPRLYTFSVTGGTGVYAGSTGSFQATTIAGSPRRVEYLLFSLVP